MLVEHAADLATRCVEGDDGRTAWTRLKRGDLIDFGSQVLHRVPGKVEGGLLQARWLPGTWLGKRWATNEHVVSLPNGRVVRARAVKHLMRGESSDKEKFAAVTGAPLGTHGNLKY